MADSNVKVTSRMFLETVLAKADVIGLDEDYIAKGNAMLEALDKKKDGSKPTKTQVENEGIKNTILETLNAIGSGTVTTILKSNEAFAELSNQKLSALLRQLIEEGKVVKTTEKKTSYFSLAE